MRGWLYAATVVAVLAMLATGNVPLSGQQQTAQAGTARAKKAVRYAVAQVGKPYRWGAEGPRSFDCSGLMFAAWRHAGVRIPRTAAGQLGGLPRVRGQVRPGDLIVYASNGPTRRHVAMAVGRGRMVEALGSGIPVKVVRMRKGWLGVVRPKTPAFTRVAPRGAAPSRAASADIPPRYLQLYQQTGHRYRIPWSILAGIGKVESDHGRDQSRGVHSGSNSAGACGPMQIGCVPGSAAGNSWAVYGRGSPYDPANAIPAAARYLVAHGAHRNLDQAIYGYNHAWWYVAKVKANAHRYQH